MNIIAPDQLCSKDITATSSPQHAKISPQKQGKASRPPPQANHTAVTHGAHSRNLGSTGNGRGAQSSPEQTPSQEVISGGSSPPGTGWYPQAELPAQPPQGPALGCVGALHEVRPGVTELLHSSSTARSCHTARATQPQQLLHRLSLTPKWAL